MKETQTITRPTTTAALDEGLTSLAFENAVQASIILTVSTGRIIMANEAACNLLGYSKRDLLTRRRSDIFQINDAGFKKMLKQRTEEGKSTAIVTVIKRSGKKISCEITSAVFMDGKILRSVTGITDLTERILKQKRIDKEKEKVVAANIANVEYEQKLTDAENERIVAKDIQHALAASDAKIAGNMEWIKQISKASYDVMWDWDISTGEVYVGESIEELFGYKVQNNLMTFKEFFSYVVDVEKGKVEKRLMKTIASKASTWSDAFLFKRFDKTVASTTIRANIMRNAKGKALRLLGGMQDISKLLDLENRLVEQISAGKDEGKNFHIAANMSYDGIWDWNLVTNEVFLGDGFLDLLGSSVLKETETKFEWEKHIHADDREAVGKGINDALGSAAVKWENSYRIVRDDGTVAEVYGRANIIRDKEGKASRMIGVVHDLSRERILEERLEEEIKLKEQRIAEAAKDAKETERSDIAKELHDNVNQLLTTSRMYLAMARKGGSNSAMFITRSSEYTLKAIEEIRKLTKGLTTDIIKNLGLGAAIDNICSDMMEVNPVKISCSLDGFNERSVDDKFKLNIYRIVQEQLNNILKHANAKKIGISLTQNTSGIVLTIADNGIGFDTSRKQKGIGLQNIKNRANTYKGEANFASSPGEGCVLTVIFPLP